VTSTSGLALEGIMEPRDLGKFRYRTPQGSNPIGPTDDKFRVASVCRARPWAALGYYAYYDDYNFYFVSAKDSLHATHVMENPHVGVAIFDSTVPPGAGDGVQIEGTAKMVGILELPKVLLVYFVRRFRDPRERASNPHFLSEYFGLNLLRFFKIEVVKPYTLDLTIKDIDKRV